MQIVGLVISWAVAIGIMGIGIGYAAKSGMNATGFGLPRLPEREADILRPSANVRFTPRKRTLLLDHYHRRR
jgi:hypothetical protein